MTTGNDFRCGKCKKPVKSISTWFDSNTFRHIFEAQCHGDTEKIEVFNQSYHDKDYLPLVFFKEKWPGDEYDG